MKEAVDNEDDEGSDEDAKKEGKYVGKARRGSTREERVIMTLGKSCKKRNTVPE